MAVPHPQVPRHDWVPRQLQCQMVLLVCCTSAAAPTAAAPIAAAAVGTAAALTAATAAACRGHSCCCGWPPELTKQGLSCMLHAEAAAHVELLLQYQALLLQWLRSCYCRRHCCWPPEVCQELQLHGEAAAHG